MTLSSRYRLLMMGPILVVVLNAWFAFHALGKLFDAEHWLSHTLEVLSQTEATQLAMSSANNAARAYMLTGSAVYEQRYHDVKSEVGRDLDRTEALTRDNADQQQRLALLRERVSSRLAALDGVVEQRRTGGEGALTAAVLRPALNDSPDGGPSVKSVLEAIAAEERHLLQMRYQDARTERRNVMLTFGVASLLDLALLLVAFQQLINASRGREELAARSTRIIELNAELSALNADLEGRVMQRTRELELSNQELQAFSYSVSHDLRAPLRTIDGFSLALEEDFAESLNEEGRDYIRRVRSGVQRMGTLIDALLQLSRVTRSEVQRETVDLSALATQIFGELAGNESGREIVFEAEPGLVDETDPRLMRVAFENLFGNALKFTSKTPEARITFGGFSKKGQKIYFIRDNGAGFDMQYVDRLFTAFQRLHGDRDFKGSGIGLATVSRIIRRHHGTIWAEGAIGTGATFFFTLNSLDGEGN